MTGVLRHRAGLDEDVGSAGTSGGLEGASAQVTDGSGARDVGEAAVPEREEVLDGEAHARLVVPGHDVDGERVPVGQAGPRQDGRHVGGHLRHEREVGQRADDDEAVEAQVGEGARGVGLAARLGQHRPQPGRVQDGPQALEDVDEPGVAQVVQDEADRAGPPWARLRAVGSGR